VSRISFDPIDAEPQPEAAMEYYNDGTVVVTKRFITLGAPYNQTYNLAAIQGVSHGKEDGKFLGFFLWIGLCLFGLLYGSVLFFQLKSYGFGFIIFFGSVAILYKIWTNFTKYYVELKLGGLNNQILYMKKYEGAEHLAFCIRKAMQDLHTPPDPGQPVAYAPVFPDPVLTRN
jgi:hypothetical protein